MKNYVLIYLQLEIYKISSWNMIFINILMIFGVKEKSIILTHTMYCYKYTCANYDWFVCVFQGHIFKMLIYSCDYSIITDYWSLHYSSLQCHMILQKSF